MERKNLNLHVERTAPRRRRRGWSVWGGAILILLAVAMLCMGGKQRDQETPQEMSESTSAREMTALTRYASEEVEAVGVSFGEEDYVVERSGQGFALRNSENFVVDEEIAGAMFGNASRLEGIAVCDGEERLAEFGLENPELRVILYGADGTAEEWLFGKKTPSEDAYYIRSREGTAVYAAPGHLYRSFALRMRELYRLPAKSNIPDAADVWHALIERPGEETVEIGLRELRPGLTSPLGLLRPVEHDLDGVRALEVLDQAAAVLPVAYLGENEELPDCGFDRGSHVLLEDLRGNRMEYWLGDFLEDGTVCLRMAGSEAVFTADASATAFLQYACADYLVSPYSSLIALADVDGAYVQTGEIRHEFRVERGQEDRYFADGTQIEEHAFKRLYQAVIGVMNSARCEDASAAGKPWVTVTFVFSGEPYVVEYLEYDDVYCALRRDGCVDFLVRKTALMDMLDALSSPN